MGGFGSGRRPERTRYAVEDMRSIPMSWIKVNKAALLKAPRVINWKVGDSSYGSALIGLEGNSVRVTFQVREAKDRPWQHLAVSVETIEQPCHLGGVRRWFVCPRCGQRVGTLYIGLPALHAAYLLECPSRQNGKASIEKEKNPISDGGRAFGRAAADATENLLTTPTTVPEGRRAD